MSSASTRKINPSSHNESKFGAAMLLPFLLISLFSLLLWGSGCAKKGDIVAKVGKEAITSKEFKDEMILRFRTAEFASQRTLDERKQALDHLITLRKKLQEAYRLDLDKDTSVQRMANEARDQAAIQELYKVKIMDKVIPPEEIKDYYKKMGEEIKASHILIKTDMNASEEALAAAKAKLDSLRKILIAGADFDSIAKLVSEDVTTAQNGGDLGYFSWGRMVDEFQEAAFKLKVGEISEPVKTAYGYHLIKLYDRRPATSVKSFEEEENNIRMQLRRKYQTELNKAAEEYLTKLKESHGLKYDYAIIQKIIDKVSDPSVPRNNSYFSNFSEEEKNWIVASMKDDTIRVSDLEAEIAKTGATPQWRDQKAITSMVERLVVPKFLADDAKKNGLFNAPDVKKAYNDALHSRMIQLAETREIEDKINLADSAMLAYYQNNLDKFMTDSTVEVQEIYITVEPEKGKDLAFAQRIANRAKKGENFTNLVKKYTERKSSLNRDGKLGPLTSRQYGEMGKTAFRMKIGEISDPIPMGSKAYSIIKLIDRSEPRVKTFEEARSQVERQLRIEMSDSLKNVWTKQMDERYPVTIYEDRIMAVLPMPAKSDKAQSPDVQDEKDKVLKIKEVKPVPVEPKKENK
jgi:parvulin-like peptidyl-prolyl isomerase